jgi:hypothetical protein
MYREQQVGGNCRIHALNAYFQRPLITEDLFKKYIENFDSIMNILYHVKVNSLDFDLINSDQNNIICYILKHETVNVSTEYYALNQHFTCDLKPQLENCHFFFMYNADHIWGVKKHNEKWYILDSLRPITETTISAVLSTNNIGLILVAASDVIFAKEIKNIRKLVVPNPRDFIIKCHYLNEILGEVEISIGKCVDILSRTKSKTLQHKIDELCVNYYTFLTKFTDGNYNNLDLKLNSLPDIILGISFLAHIYGC